MNWAGITSLALLLVTNVALTHAEALPLFNEDLSDAHYVESAWQVDEAGVLTATEDHNVWTREVYSNFELELEFKNESGTNSGVIVYCSDRSNWVPNSIEIQIADDYSAKWSSVDPSWQCGAFFGHKRPDVQGVVNPPGEWNHMRVRGVGPNIVVWMNSRQVNSIDLSEYTSAEIAPDGTEIPHWLSRPWADIEPTGYIGFQGKHGDAAISFRNVTIRSIAAED